MQNRVSEDALAMMRYQNRRKSLLVAYLLWFLLGYVGGHRFYLGYVVSAFVMLLISAVSLLLTVVLIGHLGLAFIGLWWLLDALLIPGLAARRNERLIAEIRGG